MNSSRVSCSRDDSSNESAVNGIRRRLIDVSCKMLYVHTSIFSAILHTRFISPPHRVTESSVWVSPPKRVGKVSYNFSALLAVLQTWIQKFCIQHVFLGQFRRWIDYFVLPDHKFVINRSDLATRTPVKRMRRWNRVMGRRLDWSTYVGEIVRLNHLHKSLSTYTPSWTCRISGICEE